MEGRLAARGVHRRPRRVGPTEASTTRTIDEQRSLVVLVEPTRVHANTETHTSERPADLATRADFCRTRGPRCTCPDHPDGVSPAGRDNRAGMPGSRRG